VSSISRRLSPGGERQLETLAWTSCSPRTRWCCGVGEKFKSIRKKATGETRHYLHRRRCAQDHSDAEGTA